MSGLRKRPRVERCASAPPPPSPVVLGPGGRLTDGLLLFRRTEAFVRGAVLRVKMVNFMTYGECTVEPGARLNLVLGPNGTPPPPPLPRPAVPTRLPSCSGSRAPPSPALIRDRPHPWLVLQAPLAAKHLMRTPLRSMSADPLCSLPPPPGPHRPPRFGEELAGLCAVYWSLRLPKPVGAGRQSERLRDARVRAWLRGDHPV